MTVLRDASRTGIAPVPASFRDPSGFVYVREGVLYRQVQPRYQPQYDYLRQSGLYTELVRRGWLVPHDEADLRFAAAGGAYKVLRPLLLESIAYPYEWCFSQLKHAALRTLAIQALALDFGMALKDASAYNIQYHGLRPVLIDVLSFEQLPAGRPWVAYRQFCRHFLAPLALASLVDARLLQLLRVHLDGVPLDLASRLLPTTSRLRPSLLLHIHVHAAAERWYAMRPTVSSRKSWRAVGIAKLRDLVASLEAAVERLDWDASETEWGSYDVGRSYSSEAFERKRELVTAFVEAVFPRPKAVLDLGANTGTFSRQLAAGVARVVAVDADPGAVEHNYRACLSEGRANVLPLWVDLTNPGGGSGWRGEERRAFIERYSADLVLCLALVHHLALGGNVPLVEIARLAADLAPWLLIEFVPKADPQVIEMLAAREDVFDEYTQDGFESAFASWFRIERRAPIAGSARSLYLMRRRDT